MVDTIDRTEHEEKVSKLNDTIMDLQTRVMMQSNEITNSQTALLMLCLQLGTNNTLYITDKSIEILNPTEYRIGGTRDEENHRTVLKAYKLSDVQSMLQSAEAREAKA